MKNYSLLLLFTVFYSLAFGQVKYDYDKDFDFEAATTYTIVGWQKDSDQILNKFDKERLLNALENEFAARGMSEVKSNADLELTLYIVVEQKTSRSAYTTFNGGYGYRGRWGWGYGGMGSASTSYSESDYLEGTFVIDIYNPETKELVWQGIITDTVKEKPEKREKSIPKVMKKLMKKYPVKNKKK